MKLLLDEMTLRFVWGSSGEYWYSRIDSQIHSSAELECADNKKVSAVLEKLSGNEYIDTFWKYFNAYSSISEGFDEFENKFVIDKVKDWCEANSIEYTVAE